MTKRIMAVLLAGGVLLTGWAFAQEPPADKDEPPPRLKKKVRPDEEKPDQPKEPKEPVAGEKKPGEPGKEPEPAEPEENDKEILDRVAKNMRSLEERLANKELGDGTRQVGDDILKDLESLIRMSENPPQGGGGASEDSQNNPSGSSNDQKNQSRKNGQGGGGQRSPSGGKRGDKSNQQGSGNTGAGSQQPGGGRKPAGGGKQPGTDPMGKPESKSGNNPMGGTGNNGKAGNDKTDPLNPNADLYKDIWGHLPEALRAEMNAYSSDKEMIPKYDALIKKCSRTIAEQGSRKDK